MPVCTVGHGYNAQPHSTCVQSLCGVTASSVQRWASPPRALVTLNEAAKDGHDPGLSDRVTQDLRVLKECHTAVDHRGQLHGGQGEGGNVVGRCARAHVHVHG